MDHVTNKLGNNILRAIEKIGKEEDKLEQAIKAGYLTTDEEFLSQVDFLFFFTERDYSITIHGI